MQVVTINDIATKVGCADSLVSDVLNNKGRRSRVSEEKRNRILSVAKELGYRKNEIARAVRTGKTNIVGFVTKNLQNGYAHMLLEGVMDGIVPQNYSIKIITTNNSSDAEQLADQCIRYCFDGVIIYDYDPKKSLIEFKNLLTHHGIPMIMAGGDTKLQDCVCIKSDLNQGGRIAFEHLYQQGHRRIATLFILANEPHFIALHKGFADAAALAGVPIPAHLDFKGSSYQVKVDLDLLKKEKVTAVFCNSDFQSLELLTYCLGCGIRIPDDLAILGRGNLQFTRSCYPTLSSIDEDLYGMGKRAATLLIEQIANPLQKPFFEYYPHELCARESTGTRGSETTVLLSGNAKRKESSAEKRQIFLIGKNM